MSEKIELHPYDPGWPAAFDVERAAVREVLPEVPLAIEHIGSTAVPGLDAKPVIDILVLVAHLDDARPAVPPLEAMGYSYWRGNRDTRKLFFVKGLPPAPHRTHHLHIYADEAELRRHVAFRDRLRTDEDARAAYLALKRDLANRFREDREAYANGKSAFIDQVVFSQGGPARRVAGNP